ncbi:MAG: hypothetical protein GC171_10125 [Terrimonas sp.]|nr:hypothetical protein [Terrimonas sp.]
MKIQNLRTVVFFLLLINRTHAQEMVTVNNMPGTAANYRTLQGAIDSVSAGTIILLQPSSASYGIINISKLVSIIGSGYFLGLNPAPYTQANTTSSQVDGISFTTGAQGSVISGLRIGRNYNNFGMLSFSNVSNITIKRCGVMIPLFGGQLFNLVINNASSIYFEQNYFESFQTTSFIWAEAVADIKFNNNLFNFITGGVNFVQASSGGGIDAGDFTFTNNTIYFGSINQPDYYGLGNYFNNIILFTFSGAASFNLPMSVAQRNISNRDIFPPGSDNISNVNAADVLYFNTDPAIASPDAKLQLKPGSPAAGYGTGNIDAGAFGGNSGYVLSGIPFIPNIYSVQTVGTPTSTGGLQLRLKIKANQ